MTVTLEPEPHVATRPCPICEEGRVSALQTMHFILPDEHPLTDQYDVVACRSCGFVYADTASAQADYDRYYADSSKYTDARTSTGAGEQAWDNRRLEDTARTIAAHVGRDAQIVDIGCANGGLLRWLGRLGYERRLGIDPSPSCVSAARQGGADAIEGSLFAMPDEAPIADCVVLSHVLEHVRDLATALTLVRTIVRDGGVAYVEVPDATRYAECLAAPFQDFNVEHINHFSPVSLTNALGRAGFRVEALGRKTIPASPTSPYPAVWAIARAESAGETTMSTDIELPDSIRAYIEESVERLAVIDRSLTRQLEGVSDLVVWGTGQTTLMLLTATRLGVANIVAFTDSNPRYHGRRLAGKPVIAPEDLASVDAPILVGSILHRHAITERIKSLGLPHRVIGIEVV